MNKTKEIFYWKLFNFELKLLEKLNEQNERTRRDRTRYCGRH